MLSVDSVPPFQQQCSCTVKRMTDLKGVLEAMASDAICDKKYYLFVYYYYQKIFYGSSMLVLINHRYFSTNKAGLG